MKALKKMILKYIDGNRGMPTELANIARYASGNKLMEMLEKPDGEIDNFDGFVRMLEFLYPEEYLTHLSNASKDIDPGKATARFLLEFLSLNRQFEGMDTLLDRMEKSKNKAWVKPYRLLKNHQVNFPNVDYQKMLVDVRSVKSSDSKLILFTNILRTYCYHQLGRYNMVMTLAEEIEFDLENLTSNYLMKMYRVRHSETMSYLTLRVCNDEVAARTYADYVINSNTDIGKSFEAYGYFIKGYSYIFNCYEFTRKHFSKSLELYSELGREVVVKDLEEKLELVDVLWGKSNYECKYIKNKILKKVNSGNDVTEILEENKDKLEKAFYLYIKGKNEKNNTILLKSIIEYMHIGDAFLANLPRIECIKNGFDEEVLNDLITLRVS